MTVYFYNRGELDLETIRTMGVSVKDSANPIGYFGTGMKYAIATLLRTGHTVVLRVAGEHYRFDVQKFPIRGQDFDVVFMNAEKLPFTTDLGKNWEPWMAFRELASNAMDEGGGVHNQDQDEFDTVWIITGKGIQDAYHDRSKIFCTSIPMYEHPLVDIHSGNAAHMYYRSVRAKDLEKPSIFTYNLQGLQYLTEDRTLKYEFEQREALAKALPTINDKKFAEKLIFCRGYYEETLDFTKCSDPSPAFLDAVDRNYHNMSISMSARNLLAHHRPRDIESSAVTETEKDTISKACELATFLGARVYPDDLKIVDDLGPDVLAMMKDKQIYLTKRCIANGVDFLAITLYEEWVHRDLGYRDETRAMQQHLFDKILQLAKELRNAKA